MKELERIKQEGDPWYLSKPQEHILEMMKHGALLVNLPPGKWQLELGGETHKVSALTARWLIRGKYLHVSRCVYSVSEDHRPYRVREGKDEQ